MPVPSLRPVALSILALVLGTAAPSFADRIADERASAALMRIELRPDQKEAFTKIVKDYFHRRNTVLKRELNRSGTESAVRHMKSVLPNINAKTRKQMGKVLDDEQLEDADAFLDASTEAFLSDLESR